MYSKLVLSYQVNLQNGPFAGGAAGLGGLRPARRPQHNNCFWLFSSAELERASVFMYCSRMQRYRLKNGQNCQNRPINGDTLAWGVYGDFSKTIKVNPYDSNTKAIEWSQLSDGFANCPPKKPAKGQIKFSYANSKNNFCSMGGGNTSCVYANVGKKDGSDDYLYAEFNLCEF